MQPIPLPQIDRRHPRPPPPLIPLIIRLNSLAPKLSLLLGAILAESDINQEIAVVEVRLEIWGGVGRGPVVNGSGAGCDAVPAAEFAGAF